MQEVVASRPGDVEAWLVQARQLDDDEQALAAAEQALVLMPRHVGAWEARFERLHRLERSEEVQQLLDAMDNERHRSVASRLYFDGKRLAGDDGADLDAALRSAWTALDRCDRHEHLREAVELGAGAGSDPLERAREIVNSRRQAGHIASAIGRGVRG